MARVALLSLLLLAVWAAGNPVLARKPSRRLNSPYPTPKSGSSPVVKPPSVSPPYSQTPSGNSPVVQTPTPVVPLPPASPSPTPLTPSPLTPTPLTPTPVVLPPVVSSPTGGYGGYGSGSGRGTSGFFRNNPNAIPRILSLVSSLAKLFGPRLLKLFRGGLKPPSLLGALKDTSPDAMPSLFREASASLINSYASKGFPLSSAQVITQFNDALDSPDLAAQQALAFQHLNEGV